VSYPTEPSHDLLQEILGHHLPLKPFRVIGGDNVCIRYRYCPSQFKLSGGLKKTPLRVFNAQ
jgi:hypothetical protein